MGTLFKILRYAIHKHLYIGFLTLLFINPACLSYKKEAQTSINNKSSMKFTFGTVESTDVVTLKNRPGNPVAGAIVGGLFAGVGGAVVGAAIEHSRNEKPGLVECGFILNSDGVRVLFSVTANNYARHALEMCLNLKENELVPLYIEKSRYRLANCISSRDSYCWGRTLNY